MKPLVSANTNTGIKASAEIPLSEDNILKLLTKPKQFHINRINSPEWEQAVIRSRKFSTKEISELRNELTTQLNRVKLGSGADEVYKRWKMRIPNHNAAPEVQAVHLSYFKPKGNYYR